MKNLFFVGLSLFIISCNSNVHKEEEYDFTYKLLIKQNGDYNKYLSENIESQASSSKATNKESIVKYDRLTKDYLSYLESIEKEIEINSTDIFFSGDTYSQKGKEFVSKTNFYKSEY